MVGVQGQSLPELYDKSGVEDLSFKMLTPKWGSQEHLVPRPTSSVAFNLTIVVVRQLYGHLYAHPFVGGLGYLTGEGKCWEACTFGKPFRCLSE